jgi:hypothetical protein
VHRKQDRLGIRSRAGADGDAVALAACLLVPESSPIL